MSCFAERDYVELFRSAFDPLWRFVRRRVTSADDADDITAEVFTVAWRRRAEWPPPAERRLWLFGVARNVLKTHQRSIYRQDRLTQRLIALGEVELGRLEPARGDDAVWVALAQLDPDDRDLLIMRAWDQLAVSEIARLLDCTANAASIRLTRARTALRVELARAGTTQDTEAEKDRGGGGHETSTRPRRETNR